MRGVRGSVCAFADAARNGDIFVMFSPYVTPRVFICLTSSIAATFFHFRVVGLPDSY